MSGRRHVVSILVDNNPGELARIVGLFSGRGFNIDSLAVNTTVEPTKSRVVLTTTGDDRVIEQITKQLNKLVRVYKVHLIEGGDHIERELCLATVRASTPAAREEIERVVKLTKSKIVTFSSSSFTLEVTGTSREIDEFLDLVRPLGVKNMVRSAPIAMHRPQEAEQGVETAS